jgi:co-chaperonin GroES (HSP10)
MKAANQKIICAVFILLALMSSQSIAQEKSKTGIVEELDLVVEEIVREAQIVKAAVIFSRNQKDSGVYIPDTAQEKPQKSRITTKEGIESDTPAEKTQFDVILSSRIVTNKNGEFALDIPINQFKKIPAGFVFDLKLKIKPPKDFKGIYKTDEAVIKLKQSAGPKYELILNWIPDAVKSNKGTFAVSSRAQT